MASPSYRTSYGSGPSGYTPSSSSAFHSRSSHDHHHGGVSIWDEIMANSGSLVRRIWAYARRQSASGIARKGMFQLRRNIVRRRLLSFPHLLVALWAVVLLWGERWTFATKVQTCDWDHWEDWPAGATPHRLIFVADPQLIDPHSYPGRPWPINPLTMKITDNYMKRSYTNLQKTLRPDSVVFLGDLFDGGREWKTAQGDFVNDPEWAKDHRPAEEKKFLKKWNKKYGEHYWLKEYARFGRIFFDNWKWGGTDPHSYQRGRKIISSLPGNHDLGFGAEVKVPVRQRFEAYFGDTNRVDIIGNHTFVSVDTVSLSADTSIVKDQVDLHEIYQPVNSFLDEVKSLKQRAVEKELRFWRGEIEEVMFQHKVEELDQADFSNLPTLEQGQKSADLPTILLSHVPLYRDPGIPCGPNREHWPPTKPPKGQASPVVPDHRNAISVSAGYQYQNVLSEDDSVKLVKSIGNVIHAFSGDDHDYCELVHSPSKESIREITVKSLSMAMGVPTPGFQMVSLYNPIDSSTGNSLQGSPAQTLQTHLCLLPNQISTYITYTVMGIVTVLILIARAFLVPILHFQPFALEPLNHAPSAVLPVFKAKTDVEEADELDLSLRGSTTTAATSASLPSARMPSTRVKGGSAFSSPSQTRFSAASTTDNYSSNNLSRSNSHSKNQSPGKWGWGQSKGPRIQIRRDNYYTDDKFAWKPASSSSRSRSALGIVATEIWTTTWRVVWMALAFFAWLTWTE
ncbi:hypothetical protein F5Y16DRAFT_216938 [Xylariaceae sp. FL0255]|nr:hypothetical protein F5Y16DRAFT_216938 [Xylariaceae sp. FL0255]